MTREIGHYINADQVRGPPGVMGRCSPQVLVRFKFTWRWRARGRLLRRLTMLNRFSVDGPRKARKSEPECCNASCNWSNLNVSRLLDSWALRNWYPKAGVVETAAVNRDFEPGFTVDLLAKDLHLALHAGADTATGLRYATKVAADLDTLIGHGLGGKDCSVFGNLIENGSLTGLADAAPTNGDN